MKWSTTPGTASGARRRAIFLRHPNGVQHRPKLPDEFGLHGSRGRRLCPAQIHGAVEELLGVQQRPPLVSVRGVSRWRPFGASLNLEVWPEAIAGQPGAERRRLPHIQHARRPPKSSNGVFVARIGLCGQGEVGSERRVVFREDVNAGSRRNAREIKRRKGERTLPLEREISHGALGTSYSSGSVRRQPRTHFGPGRWRTAVSRRGSAQYRALWRRRGGCRSR